MNHEELKVYEKDGIIVKNIDNDMRLGLLDRASDITRGNNRVVYVKDYDYHPAKPCFIRNMWWTKPDDVVPAHYIIRDGYSIETQFIGTHPDEWCQSIITVYRIKDDSLVCRFKQTEGFDKIRISGYNKTPHSVWVQSVLRSPVMEYIVGELQFTDFLRLDYKYKGIDWDEMTTLFSIITEEERKALINDHTDHDDQWHKTDPIYQAEILANAEIENGFHDYDWFKKQFKREDILAAIRHSNVKHKHEIQLFLNHCVKQETEEDRRKRWEL